MYGALTIAPELLSESGRERYKACYCGLCRCIKEKYGNPARMTLSYDMTFLVVFLSSLNEPEESSGSGGCLVHPFQKREWWRSKYTAYAADMTIALAYLKLRDNWQDGLSLLSLAESAALKSSYERIKKLYPDKFSIIESCLSELRSIEKSGKQLPDEASACFGELFAEVLDYETGRWSDSVRALGRSLGEYIYILDAAVDLDKDRLSGSYNPFLRRYGLPDNPAFFREILSMLLGNCVRQYNYLPLVQDEEIIKNILSVGLWSLFVKKYGIEEGPFDVSGSI